MVQIYTAHFLITEQYNSLEVVEQFRPLSNFECDHANLRNSGRHCTGRLFAPDIWVDAAPDNKFKGLATVY